MATVFRPNADRLKTLGFASIAHVPVIFDSNEKYCRDLNRYLRERATLQWEPTKRGNVLGRRQRFPKHATLLNIAYCLSNFIEWCEHQAEIAKTTADKAKFDWRNLVYDDLLRYQADQRNGIWSAHNRPLRPETANTRTDQATHFLTWAATRGLRSKLDVKLTTTRRILSFGNSTKPREVTHIVRAGTEPVSRSRAWQIAQRLPTPEEVRAWLRAVRNKRGLAKYLACRFILEAGPRRHEVEAVTIDQWPNNETLDHLKSKGQPYAVMELTITKGDIPRDIMIPLPFAYEVRAWIDGKRLRLEKKYFDRHKIAASRQIFLSDSKDFEGIPIADYTIYKCFREVNPRPPKWSPHLGRHAFACFFVWHALQCEAAASGKALSELGADWVANRGEWWLGILRRQLGHLDERTTEIYLRWLVTASGLADMANGWHAHLNSESD
jgi:hypothetical protein